MNSPLEPEIDVSNVYVFLSDALRWSEVPTSIAERGATFKTVASACATMRAVSSILTGVNPPEHGVASWNNQLTKPTLLDLSELNSGFYNPAGGEHGGLNVVLDRDSVQELETIESPFVYFERDQGGHAPYAGYTYDEMLEEVPQSSDTLRSYYRDMISKSVARFEDRLETLRERDLLDDTLVIFLGDHGELLGENGLVSHSSPPTSELVYVPTTFIHPDMEPGQRPETIGHVDIVPTVLDALQTDSEGISPDGVSLFESAPGPRYNDSIHTQKVKDREITIYHARGLWDGSGGYTFTPRGKLLSPVVGWKKAQGWNREYWKSNPKQIPEAIRTLGSPKSQFGEPEFTVERARQETDEIWESEGESKQVEIDESVESRLEDLGYR